MNDDSIICRALGKVVVDVGTELAILHDVHFSLKRGQSLAIVGPSGSGKSTLLGLLAGLDLPSSGSVVVDGAALAEMNEDQRALWRMARIGFVFQQFHLLADRTALENVSLPLELAGVAKPLDAARELLSRVGLGERMQHLPKYLSGGEQQRVALARAFVVKPAILFADEPTGSLDAATGERVMQLMFDLNREFQTTLVLVTHDARLAERCDARLTLEQGRVVASHGLGVPTPAASQPSITTAA